MRTKATMGALLLLAGVTLIGVGANAQQAANTGGAPAAAAVQPKEATPAAQPAAQPAAPAPAAPAPAAPVPAAPVPAAPVPAAAQAVTPEKTAVVPVPAVPAQPSATNAATLLVAPDDKTSPIPGATASTNPVNENLISITLDEVEMADVVRMFTRISGANIITSPSNLQGRVSVNLTDVEWKPALEAILDMNHLALEERTPGSAVYSINARKEGPEPLLVETYFLRYASVSNVTPVVSAMLASGGRVSVFPSRNAVVVRTTAANLGEIRQIIEKIDRLREQVFIEAKFMELDDKAIKDLGINWQVLQNYNVSAGNMKVDLSDKKNWDASRKDASAQWDKRQNVDKTDQKYDLHGVQYEEITSTDRESPPGSGIYVTDTVKTPTRNIVDTIDNGKDITSDISDGFTKSVADIRTAVLGIQDFKLVLSALKQMSGISIVSNPKIIVANEEPATIHIGETRRPFISTVTPASQNAAAFTTYNPGEPVETGVKLVVTPTVNTESNITVRIQPELTRLMPGDETSRAPDGQTYPVISTKKIMTVFCLESGKTVAIGGLTQSDDQDVTTKIPLLGDIPLIGKYLFSHTHKQKWQTETIIFVTVGLAVPGAMHEEIGLPENAELAQRQILQSQARRAEYLAELDKARRAREAQIEKKARKTEKRLLKDID